MHINRDIIGPAVLKLIVHKPAPGRKRLHFNLNLVVAMLHRDNLNMLCILFLIRKRHSCSLALLIHPKRARSSHPNDMQVRHGKQHEPEGKHPDGDMVF